MLYISLQNQLNLLLPIFNTLKSLLNVTLFVIFSAFAKIPIKYFLAVRYREIKETSFKRKFRILRNLQVND